MRFSVRSFPYPVLGNRDDVPSAAFQATLEMTTDRQFVYITVEVACSCDFLNSLMSTGDAAYVVHVECSNTLFRKAYEFQDSSYRISIPADNLCEAVEVNIFIKASAGIKNYRIPEAHPDYGESAFDVRKGDVLAVGEGHVFTLERSYDSLRNIGSIMQINESPKDGDVPMEPFFEADKIVIYLSKNDFADYKLLKHHELIAGPLTTTIVLPVLVEALHVYKESDKIDDGRRWVRALHRRLEGLNLGDEESLLILAQELLELPVKRSLSSAKMLAETSS